MYFFLTHRSIDTDDFKGDCNEETDTYLDFGQYPGVHLDIPKPINGPNKLLKTVNQAFHIADDEWQQEKSLERKKQEEMDRENEISDYDESHSSASILRSTTLFLAMPLLIFKLLKF